MSISLTESQIRMKIAKLIHDENIDIEKVFTALGVDINDAKIEAVSHFAGVIDGLNMGDTTNIVDLKKDNSSDKIQSEDEEKNLQKEYFSTDEDNNFKSQTIKFPYGE